uniref:Solute carrier family 25 member 10 n=1 Tax=Monodelphis domestica TaxID=13616 RepID=A0A5F8GJY0_MONDO
MPEKRESRWYFGGLASSGAACCTHPLDLLKVHLQTQQKLKMRMTGMAIRVVQTDGFLALYNGLSASLCRQMTYSLTRFAIYDTIRDWQAKGKHEPLPFYKKVLLGSLGGFAGGLVGTPADMVNVRMQNDMKLPLNQRRNFSQLIIPLYRCYCVQCSPGSIAEGLKKLFSGASMASTRGALVTVGQLSCYDQAKQLVLSTGFFSDNIATYFLSSFIAVSSRNTRGLLHCAKETAKLGPLAFYKGIFPAGIRLVPHTVLTFIFLEELRKYFGVRVNV